jgi:hypothetical protein
MNFGSDPVPNPEKLCKTGSNFFFSFTDMTEILIAGKNL